ncbi:cyclic peptide export ABC transporter [Andreprevotia chitinilytica]|uniref:cyclic peptide export ABC transporter n=1 Tax=Andreprevotia chitinilytica TaxID=396808 RepID=UPI0005579538|nr:cyclic peptide export ABC transporter [Andreprevotia chitinilytica]
MNLFLYLYRQSRSALLLSIIGSLISGLAGASLVGIISRAIDGAQHLPALAGLFFGMCLVFLIAKSASELLLLHLTQNAILRLRISLSTKLLATPLSKLQELGKHGLLAVLTKDIDTFVQAFQLVPLVFGNAVLIAVCLTYLAWLSWPLFLVLTACLCVGGYGFHLAERRPLRLMTKVRDQVDTLYQHFRSLIDGSKELQLNAQRGHAFVSEVIAPGAEYFRQIFTRGMTNYTWVLNIGGILFYVVIGVMVFVTPIWLPLPRSQLITATLILLYLIGPISVLLGSLPSLRQAGIALRKMQRLDGALDAPTAGANRPDLHADPFSRAVPLRLELQNVVHHYPGDVQDSRFKLGPLNLTIQQGEIVFIIGGNGSGKTTLAMLLVGLYDIEAGAILLNGVPMDASNNAFYRQRFAAVFADFHLFEQLLTAGPEVADKAKRYIDALGIGHKVTVVDGKFSTVNLSTGQRKRLALVSSYLEDRPIYLFDEWAADQDPAFKRVFYAELLPDLKARGKTVIVISHDDAYFGHADRIIKLEEGRLKERRPSPHAFTEDVTSS